MNDVVYEDKDNYLVKQFVSPQGLYKLTIYYQVKNGRLIIDDEVWTEAGAVPSLEDIESDY